MRDSTRINWQVFIGFILLGLIPSQAYFLLVGFSDESLNMALRQTARCGLLFFLLAFVAAPLRELSDRPLSRLLMRHRRSLGLAFAGMHTAHLLLIACRYSAIPDLNLAPVVAAIGGTAYLLMYLMVITSFDAPRRLIGPVAWRRLHKTGLYYNGFLFLGMLPPGQGEQLLNPGRAVLIVLVASALVIRIAAFIRRWRSKRHPAQNKTIVN